MYYLPVEINNRRTHICQLGTTQKFVPKFVIKNDGGKATLLRIQHQSKFFADAGICGDLLLKGKWDECKGEDYDTNSSEYKSYVIELKQNDRSNDLNKRVLKKLHQQSSSPFSISAPDRQGPDKQDLVLSIKCPSEQDKFVQVLLRLKTKSGEFYEYKIDFHIAASTHIYDVVFDFGSEASQMAYVSKRENEIKRVELVHQMNKGFYYGNIGRVDYKEFPQNDLDDNELFISYFLVRKKNGSKVLDEFSIPFKEGKQSILHLLKSKNLVEKGEEDSDYEIIPNLKLTAFGDFQNFDIEVGNKEIDFRDLMDGFSQKILNQFVVLLFKGLGREKTHFRRLDSSWSSHPKKIRLTLLVPNIYDQAKVSSLIEETQTSFNILCKEVVKSEKFEGELIFDAIEVQTISESDASFLGMSNNNLGGKLKTNVNYLIIDGGKGTMDISVVKVEGKGPQFTGIYRGGIAGAGNVLTYAFLDNLASVAVGTKDQNRRKFIKSFLKAPIDIRHDLLGYIETLKKRFSSVIPLDKASALSLSTKDGFPLHDPNTWLSLDPNQFGATLKSVLIECLIDPGFTLGDYCGIIEKTMDELVQKTITVVEGLGEYSASSSSNGQFRKELEIEAVIFSGRSFLLEPFRNKMIDKLVSQGVIADSNEIIWDKGLAKKGCIEGPLSVPSGVNRNTNLVGIPIPLPKIKSLAGNTNSADRRNWFDRKLSDIFGRNKTASNNGKTTDLLDKLLLEGLPTNYNDIIKVGNSIYLQEEALPFSKSKKEKADIIFTGDQFKQRICNSSVNLYTRKRKENNASVDPFIWKSLFPNVPEAKNDDIASILIEPSFDLHDTIGS